jgi:toxin ParE1/3/4
MKYSVDLTWSAQADLIDIVEWIAGNDSTERAMHVLGQIQSRLESLIRHPERDSVPSELKSLGIDKYRQVFFKPYRIIYQIRGQHVIVNLIADGRRDMSVLLQRRLIRVTW